MLAFVHGEPGTGKSRLIRWIRSLFETAMAWKHGQQFLFCAAQNRVAHAMGGKTIHSAGEIPVGEQAARKLEHCDVDVLYSRNQHLRWLLGDEGPMIQDHLCGLFDYNLTDAAVKGPFSKGPDGQARPFGGYNTMLFGDLYQIPPIPPKGRSRPSGSLEKGPLTDASVRL